jgi:hypothetical protein
MLFIFNFLKRKYTVLKNNVVLYTANKCVGLKKRKPYLGWWFSVHGYELPSTSVPCCKSAAPFIKKMAPPLHLRALITPP